MATEHPRIQVTLDKQSNGILSALAEEQHLSKSALAADLIRQALALREDLDLSDWSNERIRSDNDTHYSHEEAWSN